jgi:hypothetical protein
VTRFDDMPYEELKAEREYQTAQALLYAREYLNAVESGQEDWEHNMKVALTQALAQVNRLNHLLRGGVAA